MGKLTKQQWYSCKRNGMTQVTWAEMRHIESDCSFYSCRQFVDFTAICVHGIFAIDRYRNVRNLFCASLFDLLTIHCFVLFGEIIS